MELIPSHTPTNPNPEPVKRLDAYEPPEVLEALQRGEVSEVDAYHYTLRRQIADDFYSLEPEDALAAFQAGLITEHQADLYADRKESPVGFHVKDKLSAVASGIEKAGEETLIAAADFASWLLPLHEFYGGKKPSARQALSDLNKLTTPDAWEKPIDEMFTTNTTSGKVVEGITQFITSFAPISKGLKAAEVSEKLLNSSKLAPYLEQMPGVRKFLNYTLEGTIAGTITDATAFNPYESGFNDLMTMIPGLSEDVKGFLRTDPENPEWAERVKKGLAGILPGVVADGVFHGLGIMKNRLWHKAASHEDEVARVVDELVVTPKAATEAPAKPVNELTPTPPDPVDATPKPARTVSKLEVSESESRARAVVVLEDVLSGAKFDLDPDSALNLTKYNGDELVNMLARMSQEYGPELADAKGGVRTMKILEKRTSNTYQELSKLSLDKLEERVKARVAGINNIDAFLNATRDVLNSMSESAIKLYKEANGDIEKEIEAYQLLAKAGEIQKYLDYGATQVGRGLQSLKRDVKSRKFDPTTLGQAEASGEVSHMRKTLEAMSRLKSKKDRLKYARKLSGGKILQGFLEYIQAGLVSGLDTTKVNVIGNSTAFVWDAVVHHAGVLGYTLANPKEVKRLTEIHSFWKGFSEGVGMALKIKQGDRWFKPKLEGRVYKAWAEMGSQLDKGSEKFSRTPALVEFFKKKGWEKTATVADLIFVPFRNLTAQDEFFKNISYYSRREALIQREAINKMYMEGLSKESTGKFVDFLRKDTPDYIHLQALQEAQETTFTKPLEGFAKNVARAINTPVTFWRGDKPFIWHPGFIFKIGVMPFYNIAANLLDYTVERTPLKVFGYRFQSSWKAGGVERAEALARAASGVLPFALGWAWYDQNRITGYMDRETAQGARNAGIQPYSVLDMDERESEQYMKYAPVALLMALGANFSRLYDHYTVPEEIDRDIDKLFKETLLAFSDPILNQHFMKSLKEGVDLVFGGEFKNWETVGFSQANKLIPFSSALDQAQRNAFDDWVRETVSLKDLIRRKLHGIVPGVESPLPKMHPVYGTPIRNYKKQIPWYEWESLAGTNVMPITDDKGLLTLLKFGVNIKPPEDKITIQGSTRPMSPEEYVIYNAAINELGIQEKLNQVVSSPAFERLSRDPIKTRQFLSNFVSQYREAAKAVFLRDSPTAITEIRGQLERRVDALNGIYDAPNPREHLESWAKFLSN